MTPRELKPRFTGSERAATTRMSLPWASLGRISERGQGADLGRGPHQVTLPPRASTRRATATPIAPQPHDASAPRQRDY
jgi:hypothetical protein